MTTTGAHSRQSTARRGKSFWIALVVGAVAGTSAGVGWSAFSDAGYESTGTAFVAFNFPPDEEDPFSAAQFVRQRIDSYAQLGESAEVLQALGRDIGGRSASQLAGQVKVSAVPGTVLLITTAQDSDRDTSLRLVNSMMTHLNDDVVAVEAGGPSVISPVELVTVQPAISGRASTLRTDVVKSIGCLAVGLLLGAVVGGLVSRRKPGETYREPPSLRSPETANARHEAAAAAAEPAKYGPRPAVDR